MAPSTIVLALAAAAAAGMVGAFAVMRRMVLAADPLSHIALPGIGLALIFSIDPLIGAIAALLVGTMLVWTLENRTRMPTEAIIGVVFSLALAVGSLMTSGEELIHALFGAASQPKPWELVFGIVASIAVMLFVLRERNRLVISLVSVDLAHTSGINVRRLNLMFLLAFAVTVALGLKFLGVLLMGSLIIIPAATARHVARSLNATLAVSVVLAMLSTAIGSLGAVAFHVASGPVIICVAAIFFFVGLLRPRAA
ncbi:MAG TPA: metal ABC transporter permease [Gemmatimonadales bacterium]|nr:metal ABC transporter permease [Gemmatimonadales bacterium]